MPLLRRQPREVYRVYGADEFLAGADGDDGRATPLPEDDASPTFRLPARAGTRDRNARTLSAVILITGVGAACGLVIARNMPSAGQSARWQPSGAHEASGSAGTAAF